MGLSIRSGGASGSKQEMSFKMTRGSIEKKLDQESEY